MASISAHSVGCPHRTSLKKPQEAKSAASGDENYSKSTIGSENKRRAIANPAYESYVKI